MLSLLGDAYQTGEMPTITIITALTQKGTNKVERVALSDVTIDEFYLAKFEKKSKIEEEVPFKFGHFEVLESIYYWTRWRRKPSSAQRTARTQSSLKWPAKC